MFVSFCAQLGEQIDKVVDCLASCGKAGTEGGSVGEQDGLLLAQAVTHSKQLSCASIVNRFLVGCIGAYLVNVSLALLLDLASLLAGFVGLALDVGDVCSVVGLLAAQAMGLHGQQRQRNAQGGEQIAAHRRRYSAGACAGRCCWRRRSLSS